MFLDSGVAKTPVRCKFPCKVSIETTGFVVFYNWHVNCSMLGFRMGASSTEGPKAPATDSRGVRIIAKSVYRELRNSGHSRSDIVAFTNAVLELVTTELRDAQEAAE